MKQRKDWRMNCDVGEETESLENELYKGWRMICDIGKAREGLENEL